MIIGFTSGTFDMFHIGHLNLIKKAKEYCDRLIVGVIDDNAVIKNKNKIPIITIKDRLEIVKQCKYVNKAFIIKEYWEDIKLYEKYKFDIYFLGDDYDIPKYKEHYDNFNKELGKYNSKIMFLPYTKTISSTEIRKRCAESLKK
jgi:glycerol-3-phosphate cytidylyltransferase